MPVCIPGPVRNRAVIDCEAVRKWIRLAALSFAPALASADVKVEDPKESAELGRAYMREEKWNLAVEQLEKSVAIKADDYRVWTDLADALCVDARGVRFGTPERNERAAAAYVRALKLNPVYSRAWNNYAWMLAKTRVRLDEALAFAKRAVEIDDSRASYLDTLAEVYFVRGEVADAVRVIRRARELSPEDDYFRKQLERFESALATATPAPKATPRRR